MKHKVLSLLQPWASLVVMGHKIVETRSWNTKYRGPLLIHASASWPGRNARIADSEPFKQFMPQYGSGFIVGSTEPVEHSTDFRRLPFGAIIGIVNLTAVHPIECFFVPQKGVEEKRGEWIEITAHEKAFGDYSPGRYGWMLEDPVMFEQPVPAKGKLGIWDWEGDIRIVTP